MQGAGEKAGSSWEYHNGGTNTDSKKDSTMAEGVELAHSGGLLPPLITEGASINTPLYTG